MYTSLLRQLAPFTFRVLLVWYFVAVCLELLLPGFVSSAISLDFSLIVVIVMGVFSML